MFSPFGNTTQTPPTSWRSEPSTRGTWNILSTCLITLGLCLWTALHLNIPQHKEGVWRPKMRKAGWLLLGLLAPEMVAFTAWYQRQAAHKLDAVMRRELGQPLDPTCYQRLVALIARCYHRGNLSGANDLEMDDINHDGLNNNDISSQKSKPNDDGIGSSGGRILGRRHQWTTAHSFYALMGGFVFDATDGEINFLPNSRERLTLRPRGLKYLLKHEPHLVPNISKEDLCDKSNASGLAKTLICLQALWFIVQCIIRVAQGLAISLLELNVFAHTVCALFVYYWWWDKPLDIEQPTVLRGERMEEMCALMCMGSSPHDCPELPYGVRYGDTFSKNIVEASVWPDEDNLKGYWPWAIMVAPLQGVYKSFSLGFSVPPTISLDNYRITLKRLSFRRLLECRIQWTARGPGDEQADRCHQDASRVANLNSPSNTISQTSSTTHRSLSSVPAITDDHNLCPPSSNAGTEGAETHELEDNAVASIDGLSLMLGEWPRRWGPFLPTTRQRFIEPCLPTRQLFVETICDPRRRLTYNNVFVPRKPQPDYAPTSVALSRADFVRWQLCARALQRHCPQPLEWMRLRNRPLLQLFPASRCVCERIRNWPSKDLLEVTEEDQNFDFAFSLGFCVAGLMYGGLHLFAWDAPFPGLLKVWLWRGSGLLLASSGFIFVIAVLILAFFALIQKWITRTSFWKHLDEIHYTYPRKAGSHRQNLLEILGMLISTYFRMLLVALAILYCGARVYLIVESFLQLAHLPDSAYAIPSWSQYYPHIT